MDFLDYLGKEETNLLTSCLNFRIELDLFKDLDGIYQEPLGRLEISRSDLKEFLISQLYLFVHFHLYFSMACFLRLHLSESLSSTRKAIDGTLCAYKMILEPESAQKYFDRDNYFQQIKSNLQREIKKESCQYPLAHRLIKVHDICSQYGSHADVSSFFYRLEIKKTPEIRGEKLFLQYFQFPKRIEEGKYYFVVVLLAFLYMFTIFKTYFDSKLKLIDPSWEKDIRNLREKLEKMGKRLSYLIKDEEFFK